jgi:glyoxylate/succinic semialdehyde reductase
MELENLVIAKGGTFLEAPVSGSKVPAATGTLIFLCGGSKPLFEEVSGDLAVMGKASHFFGATGAGSRCVGLPLVRLGSIQKCICARCSVLSVSRTVFVISRMKIIVNMMMGVIVNSLVSGNSQAIPPQAHSLQHLSCRSSLQAEGLALCDAAGLPQDELLAVLDEGALANPIYKLKGPKMIKGDHDAHFPLKHQQKVTCRILIVDLWRGSAQLTHPCILSGHALCCRTRRFSWSCPASCCGCQ